MRSIKVSAVILSQLLLAGCQKAEIPVTTFHCDGDPAPPAAVKFHERPLSEVLAEAEKHVLFEIQTDKDAGSILVDYSVVPQHVKVLDLLIGLPKVLPVTVSFSADHMAIRCIHRGCPEAHLPPRTRT